METNNDKAAQSSRQRLEATELHETINARATNGGCFSMLICMDANETRHRNDRCNKGHTKTKWKPSAPLGQKRKESTMICYDSNFVEAHEHANIAHYNPERMEHSETYSFWQHTKTKEVKTKLDLTLIGKNMKPYLDSCEYIDTPKTWVKPDAKKAKTGYHCMVETIFSAPACFWDGRNADAGPVDLQLDDNRNYPKVPARIKIKKLTEITRAQLAREVESRTQAKQTAIDQILACKKTSLRQKRDFLSRIWHRLMLKASRNILGTSSRRTDRDEYIQKMLGTLADLVTHLSRALDPGKMDHYVRSEVLNHALLETAHSTLSKCKHVTLLPPIDSLNEADGWRKWLKKSHLVKAELA
jgi:hypothetical protein